MSDKKLIAPKLRYKKHIADTLCSAVDLGTECETLACANCAFNSDSNLLQYLKHRIEKAVNKA